MKTMGLEEEEEEGQTVDYLVHSDFDINHLTISKFKLLGDDGNDFIFHL